MSTGGDKMRAAREVLLKRVEKLGWTGGRRGVCKLDRLQGTCSTSPTRELQGLPEFRSIASQRLKAPAGGQFQGYARAHWFRHRSSGMKFSLEAERRKPWLAPVRITLYADDRTGLNPEQVFAILEVLPDFKLSMIEVAFDFLAVSRLGSMRRSALFGKSWRRSVDKGMGLDHWGDRKRKFVRVYFKDHICALRIEFELRARFLTNYRIKDVFDFWKLVDVLPGKHIFFGRIDDQKLIRHVRRTRTAAATLRILERVNTLDGDLVAQMKYLRQRVRLKNTRRLLVSLGANKLVLEAIREWARMWPKKPSQLKRTRG